MYFVQATVFWLRQRRNLVEGLHISYRSPSWRAPRHLSCHDLCQHTCARFARDRSRVSLSGAASPHDVVGGGRQRLAVLWKSLSSRLKNRSMPLSTSNAQGRNAAARQQRCQQVRTTMSRRRAPRWLPALANDAPSAQIANGLIGLLEDQRLQHSPCAPTVFMLQPARTRSLGQAT